jgi:XrtJ-associated TM-motif-TM protein
MKNATLVAVASAALFLVALPLSAQSGCVLSPENPTVVLALVGSASAFLASARARVKAKRK